MTLVRLFPIADGFGATGIRLVTTGGFLEMPEAYNLRWFVDQASPVPAAG